MKSSSRIMIFMLFMLGVVFVMMDCARRTAKQKKAHSINAHQVESPVQAH